MSVSQFYSHEAIDNELKPLVINEADRVNFCKLLEDIREFALKDVHTRNKIIVDVAFWKNEFESRRRTSEILLNKKRAVLYNAILNKLKSSGIRYTEDMIRNEVDAYDWEGTEDKNAKDMAYVHTFQLNELSKKWSNLLNDCYYVMKSTHDILNRN